MKFKTTVFSALGALVLSTSAQAAAIFAPEDTIFGGALDGENFTVGAVGGAGSNAWPEAEAPLHIIDGVGQKYLNFGITNTGVIVTPSAGATTALSMQLWTANDAVERDPTSYALYGTNTALDGAATSFALSDFALIAEGSLALPAGRGAGGAAALDNSLSQIVSFSNTEAYESYMLVFPTVVNNPAANSMQIAEVQLYDTVIPEPSTAGLLGLGLLGLIARRRRTTTA